MSSPMDDHLPSLLADAARLLGERAAGLDTRPVAGDAAHPPPVPLPREGVGGLAALETFLRDWEPGFSGSAGPRYLGFVTGGATPAAVLGDWAVSVFDQNVMSTGDSCAAELESQTIGWLREMFGLSHRHHGMTVTGATAANLVGLAIGREWLGEQRGTIVSDAGAAALGPVTILSGSPHASVYKAASILGFGRDSVRQVATRPGREAVDVGALATALRERPDEPVIVVANAGTVNTVDFDDLAALAELRESHPFWLHVDGAFGAYAALLDSRRHLVDGLDAADSVCVDLHKWLNVPYDCGAQFTRRRDLQARVFASLGAYLGVLDDDHPEPVHLTVENSRRLRALPAWMTLLAYGLDGHRKIVQDSVDRAGELARLLDADPAWRVLAPVIMNVVCFTPAGEPDPAAVARLLERVGASGEAFLTPTVYAGVPAIRAAFSSWKTTADDVGRVKAALDAAHRAS
ncbi:pyridoxal-dependent decarboxylase [Streptosporangium soli]|nr:pyridoxal-dependent decarboxylase [Streptosporangium sp. KLBMP 9127]